MQILLSIPIMAMAVILQSSLLSRLTLLNGSADLVLLVVAAWSVQDYVEDEWVVAVVAGLLFGFVSAIPIWVPILAYLAVAGLAHFIKRRIWQIPLLALISVIAVGTIISHLLTYLALVISGSPIAFGEAVNLIMLPGVLLNLLLAIPVRGVIGEVTGWIYPQSEEA